MTNLEMIRKLSLGTDDTEKVTINFEGTEAEFNIRPLTDGELTRLQAIEKKSLIFKIEMQNGKRQNVRTNMSDVDINTGEFTEDQAEAMYNAVAWSLTTEDEKITAEDVKQMKAGLPALLFEEVIRISKLDDSDLTSIKNFRKDQ